MFMFFYCDNMSDEEENWGDYIEDSEGADSGKSEGKIELENTFYSAEEMKETLLLVLANKQDLAGAMDVRSMAQQLDLNQLCKNPWYIQPCVATSGAGLYEGLDWLSSALQKMKS